MMAAAGTFAALAMIFESPLIASVVVIEAAGLGGPRLPVVLVPGLLAAGIGSLMLVGLGSWTGLNTGGHRIGILDLPNFARPDVADVGSTILLAAATAVVAFVVIRLAREAHPRFMVRPFVFLPLAAIAVAGLAIAFAETTDKGVDQVLFSGQNAVGPLVSDASTWSLTALALLIAFKGIAWSISLGAFRGGPVFPALFLGAAAGLMAARLPGLFDHAGGGRGHGSSRRVRAEAAPLRCRAGHPADLELGSRGGSACDRRGGRGLRDDADAVGRRVRPRQWAGRVRRGPRPRCQHIGAPSRPGSWPSPIRRAAVGRCSAGRAASDGTCGSSS